MEYSFNHSLSEWRKKVAFYTEDIETGIGLTINLVILELNFLIFRYICDCNLSY